MYNIVFPPLYALWCAHHQKLSVTLQLTPFSHFVPSPTFSSDNHCSVLWISLLLWFALFIFVGLFLIWVKSCGICLSPLTSFSIITLRAIHVGMARFHLFQWFNSVPFYICIYILVAQMVKNLPVMQETAVLSLGLEDPLEKEMATHSNILAWRIPWTEEPRGLQSTGSQRVRHNWVTNTFTSSLYIHTPNLFIHSPVERHWSCFHILDIVNNALVNTESHISSQIGVFMFFG